VGSSPTAPNQTQTDADLTRTNADKRGWWAKNPRQPNKRISTKFERERRDKRFSREFGVYRFRAPLPRNNGSERWEMGDEIIVLIIFFSLVLLVQFDHTFYLSTIKAKTNRLLVPKDQLRKESYHHLILTTLLLLLLNLFFFAHLWNPQ
jgi:hypothetical protein